MKGLWWSVWALLLIASPMRGQGHSGSCTCGGFAATPVPWQIEHVDDAAYAAAAADEFARWNRYAEVFDARMGDGAMAPNGTNEIGFLDMATTSAKYGINMDRITFAITYMSPLSAAGDFDACPKPPDAICGTFEETDVIMNSEFVRGFRASGPIDYSDSGPALYGATAVHELGHTLGFHHNVSSISAMNLYEDFAARYVATADTQELRRAYPAQARRVIDLATYPFSFNAELTDYAATTPIETPTIAVRGSSILIRNFGLENVGSETVDGVQIRFYLSTDAEISTADTLLGVLSFPGPIEPGAFWDDGRAGRTFTVSSELPLGTYTLGAIVSDGAGLVDGVAYNNSWVASKPVVISAGGRRRAVRH